MTDQDLARVVLLGTHGQHNIGDELLLETFLHQFGPNAHYVINTYDPALTEAQLRGRYSFELIDTARDRFSLLRHLLGADRVVFGGGSIIKELYATTGRRRHATLLMILAIVLFARVARRPVAMFNIGIGPLTTPMGKRLARLILSQVDLVTVRDPGSRELCRSLGIDAQLATDAVFAAAPEWLLGETVPERRPGPLRVALNLNYDIENPANWEHFTAQLAAGLRRLAAGRDLEIHTLPMQSRFKEHDDAAVLRSFAERLPDIRFVHHTPTTHRDAAAIIADCDVVISERLHAIVMAAILGVPSFVLAYDVKVRELAAMLGLEDFTLDINRPFSPEAVEVPLGELIEGGHAVQQRLAIRVAELEERATACFASARHWLAGGRVPNPVSKR